MVQFIPSPVLSSQQHRFVGWGKQIRSLPYSCKCEQVQALPILWGFLRSGTMGTRGGDFDEQLEWNEDNQPKVEDDKQLKVDGNPVIAPQVQFFNKEPKLTEV